METVPEDVLNCWELYVTDDDKVICHVNSVNCLDGNFTSFRRCITFGELKQDLIDHIKECH